MTQPLPWARLPRSSRRTATPAHWVPLEAGAVRSPSASNALQRDVAVLPRWPLHGLAEAKLQAPQQLAPRLARLDDVVDVPPLSRHVRVGEPRGVLGHQLLTTSRLVRGSGKVSLVDDVHGGLRAHHGYLRAWPREVQVRAHLLGRHHAIG